MLSTSSVQRSNMKKYVKRLYRIRPEHDKAVKKLSKKQKISESEVVRRELEKLK